MLLVLVIDDEARRHLLESLKAGCSQADAIGQLVDTFSRPIVASSGHAVESLAGVSDDDAVPLTVNYRQAGRLLGGVSEKSIRRLVADGELPYVEVGGLRRVARSDLDVYVARHCKANGSCGE